MRFRFFWLLLFIALSSVARANELTDYLKQSYQLLGESCGKSGQSITPENPVCQNTPDSIAKIQQLSVPMTQGKHFALLAKERKLDNECLHSLALDLKKTPTSFDKYAKDFKEKVELLAEATVENIRLSHRAREQQRNPEALKKIQEDFKKNSAEIASIENGILLGQHHEIKKVVAELVQDLTAEAATIKSLFSPTPPKLKELSLETVRAKLKKSLPLIESQLADENTFLQKGVDSDGMTFDRQTKESLAQDRDLVEKVRAENPKYFEANREVACSVERTYGRGAELRDKAIFGGSMIITAASLGAGIAARSAVAMAAATTPARMAAAEGLLALRASRILGAAAMGLDGANAIKEINRCPQHETVVKGKSNGKKSANRCEDVSIESLESSNCYLGAALSALGAGASSEKGREFVAKYFTSGNFQTRKTIEKAIGKVTDEQEIAIQKSHMVGDGERGANGQPAATGNYTWPQLKRKTEILRSSGISEEDTRKLMEAEVVGLPAEEKRGLFAKLFGNKSDDVASARATTSTSSSKNSFLSSLSPADAENQAMREFREAYKARKFEGKSEFISYKPGGNDGRVLVRIEKFESDGKLQVIDAFGNRQHLSLEELRTARVSSSPDLIEDFSRVERERVAKTFKESRDPATLEFRERWAKNELGTSAGDSNQNIISYMSPDGNRYAGRVERVLADGRLQIRNDMGIREELGTAQISSVRMASSNSQRQFVENEKHLAKVAVPKSNPATSVVSYQQQLDKIAPKINLDAKNGNQGSYLSNGYWRQWMDPKATKDMPDQGWKLHVGAAPESAEKIATSLIPELQKRGILHKVVDDLPKYAARDPAKDTQAGKFMTIYPRNDKEAKEIANLVDTLMKKNGVKPADVIHPPGELEVSPGVYARYGRFTGGPAKDAAGRTIPNSNDMLVLPNGKLVPDQRGIVAPAGIRNPF